MSGNIDARSAFHILVVEDDMMIALCIEQYVHDLGHRVVGPASRLSEALKLSAASAIDFAMLDIDVCGAEVFPVAELLQARAVPFVFLSGYDAAGVPYNWKGIAVLEKPFTGAALIDVVEGAYADWRVQHDRDAEQRLRRAQLH